MKNDLLWTETILTVYRYLERISGAIDKIIMQRALASSNIVGQNYFYNNTYSVSQRIIDLSERKITLINLKVLIEDTLCKIDPKEAKILIFKYVDKLKSREIAPKMGIALRSVFRKLESAEQSFKSELIASGYNDIKLKDMLKDEVWINQTYNALAKKDENFEFTKIYLAKAVSI